MPSRFQVHPPYISPACVEKTSLAVRVGSVKSLPNTRKDSWLKMVAGLPALMPSHPALAHGSIPHDLSGLWSAWSADPLVTVPLSLSGILFGRGVWHLRQRLGRFPPGFGPRQILCFSAGMLLLVVALLSPLEGLAKPLLSAHMVQHILLITVAPPLLVLGKPEVAWLWGLPDGWRRSLPRQRRMRRGFAFLSPLAKPIPAAVIHMAALWIWHNPTLFDAAVAANWLHWLEHVLFFGTALLFWRAVIKAASGREAAAAALIACFMTLLQSGLLSALLSFARQALYRSPAPLSWGMSPLEDQQLAGAIMSLPMCAIYLLAGLAMAFRLLTPPRSERVPQPKVGSSEALDTN
jgi:putative membrane protein